MANRVTSIEVARLAGVSQSTVSRVFSSNAPNVSAATRDRVLKAAQQLGYQPNAIARMMSTRHTNIVGIVMANITSPFYPYVLEKFLQRLQTIDRQALVFTAAGDQSIDDLLPLVLQHQVDAIIVTSITLSSDLLAIAARTDTPVILFNRALRGQHASAVCTDNVAGGALAADVLLDTGHTRPAFIAGIANTSTNQDRQHGFIKRLSERGIDAPAIAQGAYTYESGYVACLELLRGGTPPDAVFCANDIMALGAMDAARAEGLRIPDDLSIIGFDDIPMAAWGAYHLTTITQEVDAMIERTIALMLDKIDDPASAPELVEVPCELRVRGSVRGLTS